MGPGPLLDDTGLWHTWEDDAALGHRRHLELAEVKVGQVLEEGFATAPAQDMAQLAQVGLAEAVAVEEAQHLVQTRKDGVLAMEGVLPEENVKHRRVTVLARLEVRVRHRELHSRGGDGHIGSR